jgi:hypothetical protein
MAYKVDKFNGTFLVNVQDGTIDTTTDIRFIGKNYAGYGEVQNENFLHMLEHFANTSAPPRAIAGQIWYDSGNKKLKFYDGSNFRAASGTEAAASAPAGLTTGDLWFDTSANQLYAWSGNDFVLVGPDISPDLGATTIAAQVVKDTTGVNQTIAKVQAGGEVIAIVSKSAFVLDSSLNPITGFSTIKKGITLINSSSATGVTSSDHYFWGTASNSERLGGFLANDFLRAGSLEFTSVVRFSDSGILIGDQNDLRIRVESGDETVIENQLGNPLRFKIRINESDVREPIRLTSGAVIPGQDLIFNLGSNENRWSSVYASQFIGNVTGTLAGNSIGIHSGNVTATDDTIMVNATTKQFIGSFSGTLTGSVIGDVVGRADEAASLAGFLPDSGISASTVVVRTAGGNINATRFIGTTDKADRLIINDSAVDTDPDYKSAKTTATPNTIAARNAAGDLFATVFQGTATAARYADLAEKYLCDDNYESGTVVMIGGDKEVTACQESSRAIGAVSFNPAFMMNSDLANGKYIAIKGRLKIKIIGSVVKGNKLIAGPNGCARATNDKDSANVFAVAIETNLEESMKLVESIIL